MIPFLELKPGEDAAAVEAAIRRVVSRGWFVLGPELDAFEREFAGACAAPHAVGVGNGTDALAIALRALNVGSGDDVITSPLSAAYTALAILAVGARPVFADIDPHRLTLDPGAVASAVTSRTAAILPVHLYGQAADMPALMQVASRHALAVVEDCCQAHLATCEGLPVGSFGAAAAYSFYPTKNLGALGDAGALTTSDAALAERAKRIRNGGQTERYRHDEFGVNSRLDEIQAAVLRARLAFLPAWTERRRALARDYRAALADAAAVVVPREHDPGHVYHLFPVLSPARESVREHLKAAGVETLIHYPIPIPRQRAMPPLSQPCPVAERVCAEVFSLPLYPALPREAVGRVAAAVRGCTVAAPDRGPSMLTAPAGLLSLLVTAWLPGAVIYRLPVANRERRAALPAEERVFWQIVISLAVSHAVVLVLAAAHRYTFARLIAADVAIAAALAAAARFRLRLGGPRPTRSALVIVALAVLCVSRFFPPSEYVIGGKDPGTYINEGLVIAQRGTLVYRDDAVASVPVFARNLFFPSHQRPDYYGTRFMGFFIQDADAGTVVGQFPHLLPASIAIGYGIDGLTGARRVVGTWAVLGVIAVYLAGARWIGRTAAAAAAGLLALNVIEVWYGRYPNAEVVMQALLFAALLANARAHFDAPQADAFFGAVSGTLAGMLLFLRFDAVLAIGAIVFANLLAAVRGRRLSRAFAVTLSGTIAVAVVYLLGPMRAYATYPIEFVKFLRWWQAAALGTAAVAAAGLFVAARRRPGIVRWIERVTPVALVAAVWTLAIYAFFFRTPAGKLALENAYALRMYASFYVTVPCLAAALAGYALVTRRRFWHDPAIVITVTVFSVFFFYKIRVVPEHFWAARRFLPVILPGTLLLACAAATWGLSQRSMLRRAVSGAIGLVFIVLLAVHYARSSSAITAHVEYAGLIPRLEQLAARIGDRDLLLVESRDAQSDAHVLALPLAYIYARQVLVLASAAPDLATFGAFLDWARTRYERVYFLGGGGTALLSTRWSASSVASDRFQVPEYASTINAYPQGVRQKEFDFGLYALLAPSPTTERPFDLDVGAGDDLHVVRFHAKEVADGTTMRWSQDQSFVSMTALPAGVKEVVLTMSSGGRPQGPPPADATIYLDGQPLGTVRVENGFRPYSFALPAAAIAAAAGSDTPARLAIRTPVWNPQKVLGVPDSRDLGVMVDRVQVR